MSTVAEHTLRIAGHEGKRELSGTIHVGGAKNAALKAMAASILFSDHVTLANVPVIEDVHRMAELLTDIGITVAKKDTHTYALTPSDMLKTVLDRTISGRMRSSIAVVGPLLARMGSVSFPHPGGCVIGERPIDLFLEGFQRMGARVTADDHGYTITAQNGLTGGEIFFRTQSVTGTEVFMMAAVLARGKTVIKNAAIEPEIQDLANFLNGCGARIDGVGTSIVTVEGTGLLSGKGQTYHTMPDRIEAGSFLVLAALLGEDVTIADCQPRHMEALVATLEHAGVIFEIGTDTIRVIGAAQPKHFSAVNIKTHEYPGFPTDLQAPMTVFLTQAAGESLVFETIFEGRLNYVESLETMGANVVSMDPHRVLVHGPSELRGKRLESPDLRAGLAFVIAALVAKGESVIHNVYYVDRGYEDIEARLQSIGAHVKRVVGGKQTHT
jgi:UDP-N-acetylglucosamine 1-carboxyvinyltransferase